MELCTGRELFWRLAERRWYSEYDAARVGRQMLDAVAYLHSQNICSGLRNGSLNLFTYWFTCSFSGAATSRLLRIAHASMSCCAFGGALSLLDKLADCLPSMCSA
eukprot:1016857-Amphidinium_carterae.1